MKLHLQDSYKDYFCYKCKQPIFGLKRKVDSGGETRTYCLACSGFIASRYHDAVFNPPLTEIELGWKNLYDEQKSPAK